MGPFLAPRAAADRPPFTWKNEVPANLEVMTDAAQMLRVFENLGRNAREAGADTVRISGYLESGALIVEVADDGPGMPDKATTVASVPSRATRAGRG